MARGGYYQGNDYVSYQSGTLTQSTATSFSERQKQDTIKCPNCGRTVPLKRICIFCDSILIE